MQRVYDEGSDGSVSCNARGSTKVVSWLNIETLSHIRSTINNPEIAELVDHKQGSTTIHIGAEKRRLDGVSQCRLFKGLRQ